MLSNRRSRLNGRSILLNLWPQAANQGWSHYVVFIIITITIIPTKLCYFIMIIMRKKCLIVNFHYNPSLLSHYRHHFSPVRQVSARFW